MLGSSGPLETMEYIFVVHSTCLDNRLRGFVNLIIVSVLILSIMYSYDITLGI